MRPDGESDVPPPQGGEDRGAQVNRTTYQAGHVPGVSYRGGRARSPEDDETPVPQSAQPTPAAAPPAGTSVMSDEQGRSGSEPPPAHSRRGQGDEPPPRPRKKRSGFRRFLRWMLILLLIIVVALAALAWYVWGRIDKVDAIPDDHGDAQSAGQVFLLVGSDSRDDLSEDEQSDLGTGEASGQRTDTIMLLHVPEDGGRPALVSVPRDSMVDIPDEGENRINASFAFGGASLLVETLEENTGVAIDDYVQIGFGGFSDIVDSLGGVEMCLDDAVEDEKANIDLPAGCQDLNGNDALGYARARYFDPRSDLGRVERQRELISAISDKATSAGTLLNPLQLTRTALSGGDALVLDESTGPMDMLAFVRAVGAVSGDSGDTLTVPLGTVGDTVYWDEDAAGELWSAMRDGTEIPAELLEEE